MLEAALQSGVVPVINLQQIFRQASNSAIISCAHAVNAGEVPRFHEVYLSAPVPVRPSHICNLQGCWRCPPAGVLPVLTVHLEQVAYKAQSDCTLNMIPGQSCSRKV